MADVIITATGGTGTKTYYDTDICNMALARLGNADNYLTSTILTNNSTKEARLCNLHYYHALKLALAITPKPVNGSHNISKGIEAVSSRLCRLPPLPFAGAE